MIIIIAVLTVILMAWLLYHEGYKSGRASGFSDAWDAGFTKGIHETRMALVGEDERWDEERGYE